MQLIANLAKLPDPIRFHSLKLTYPEIEVDNGRITHAYFDEHISDYARQNGYQGVFICLSRYQAKRLKIESGLRGAYQNDDDAMMEGWIVADEDDVVEVDGKSINQFVKTTLHELGHEMVIYDSYETYAVCSKCGLHDWSTPKGYQGGVSLVPYFQEKYPDAIVERLV